MAGSRAKFEKFEPYNLLRDLANDPGNLESKCLIISFSIRWDRNRRIVWLQTKVSVSINTVKILADPREESKIM